MKITLDMSYDLSTLKTCYRNYYGYDKNHKVTKSDVALFLCAIVEADMQDLETEGN